MYECLMFTPVQLLDNVFSKLSMHIIRNLYILLVLCSLPRLLQNSVNFCNPRIGGYELSRSRGTYTERYAGAAAQGRWSTSSAAVRLFVAKKSAVVVMPESIA